jgi:NifU-like protein involved in Fe-S cluster formation
MQSKVLKEHFLNPRNMGTIDNPTHESVAKSDTCNDIVKMMATINNRGIVEDIKTQVYGCGYSIAGASLFTEIAKGKRAENIQAAAREEIGKLESLIPERHLSCILLSIKAYQKIYEKYSKDKSDGTS